MYTNSCKNYGIIQTKAAQAVPKQRVVDSSNAREEGKLLKAQGERACYVRS
jgi:hypothetical protein